MSTAALTLRSNLVWTVDTNPKRSFVICIGGIAHGAWTCLVALFTTGNYKIFTLDPCRLVRMWTLSYHHVKCFSWTSMVSQLLLIG